MRIQTLPETEPLAIMPWDQFWWAGAVLAVVFTLLWALLGREGRSSWADFAWAVAIGLCAVTFAGLSEGWETRRLAVGALGLIWAGRLALHLGRRLSHEGEDGRYRAMADSLGTSYRTFMLGFFLLQAFMAWVFSLPFFVLAQSAEASFTGWEIAGLAVWLLSMGGNNLSDRQLAAWKADPANQGKTCRQGLWAWSRHPNYFFEWLIWCAYPLMAVGTPAFAYALGVAVFMFVMVRYISGVPYTEQQALRSRGEDYRRYQETVSPFFPLPPKSA
jgi:steroid 5-alpha reductase family enzyme